MMERVCPNAIVLYICRNCFGEGGRLPRRWKQDGVDIHVHKVPCSGKTDAQYLFHTLEGGARGLCVVACPKGQCRLAQGNYRAEVRIRTVRRLLAEIGLEPDRAELVHCCPDDPPERLEQLVLDAVRRLRALGSSPVSGEPAVKRSPGRAQTAQPAGPGQAEDTHERSAKA